MISLRIQHRTTYHYRSPVGFGPHRLMLRPRETRDLRLTAFELTTAPQASVSWAHDVWGNAVVSANFQARGDTVAIETIARIELDAVAWLSASAIVYPFRYSDNEWTDLGALTMLQYPDPDGRLRGWARGFVRGVTTDTLALLMDLGAGVSDAILYQSRDEEGTQSPIATLDRGWGSCRDFAVLFAEAARSLGFGARIVSGVSLRPHLWQRRRWGIPCLGRGLRAGSGLDHIRHHEPQCRWRQPDPGRGRAGHWPGRPGRRELRRRIRRPSRYDGRGQRHGLRFWWRCPAMAGQSALPSEGTRVCRSSAESMSGRPPRRGDNARRSSRSGEIK
jgi:Bacterial transglutaminase-like N-terminal region/Transglutaminase-like superfamily